jgi:hypothetical protein
MSDRGDRDDVRGGWDDEALLAELRALAARADPVPERVREAARGSLTWRTIDEELARLVYDSALDAELAALVRGGEARLLTFELDGLAVEVEATAADDGSLVLVGQIVPPGAAAIEVRHPGGTVAAAADDVGRFRVAGVPAGPVSLRTRRAGADAWVATEWVTL